MPQPVRELPRKQNTQTDEDSGEDAKPTVGGNLAFIANDQSAPVIEPTMHPLDLIAPFTGAVKFRRSSSLAPLTPLLDPLRS